ncbi:hypothetical protein [Pectobacterium sp. CHL-2024]|uniref:hypothetical protein n=1 Tax=Pectobacterium sp. CHL-2024 TaxID=3377079 RepID=UPI0037FF4244
MNRQYLLLSLLICLPALASEPSRIVCEPLNKNDQGATGIWPTPYLSQGKLCFDMRVDSGDSCVSNGKKTTWLTGAVIVEIDGIPQGRDDTWFRVVKPAITDKKIEYVIEGSRDKKNWGMVSNVSINRLSGQAVDWFIGEHGGNSYQCHLEGPKI